MLYTSHQVYQRLLVDLFSIHLPDARSTSGYTWHLEDAVKPCPSEKASAREVCCWELISTSPRGQWARLLSRTTAPLLWSEQGDEGHYQPYFEMPNDCSEGRGCVRHHWADAQCCRHELPTSEETPLCSTTAHCHVASWGSPAFPSLPPLGPWN